jgi:hypothetical protein
MKKKSLIIVVGIIAAAVCWYFFAPLGWPLTYKMPKNYEECIQAGGKTNNLVLHVEDICEYRGVKFNWEYHFIK